MCFRISNEFIYNAYNKNSVYFYNNTKYSIPMYHEFMNNHKIYCKYIDLNSINIDFCEDISSIHINSRSLVNNFDDIILILDYCTFKFNIIVITEIWLHDFNKDLYNIDKYNCTHVIRKNKSIKNLNIGGGVSIYIYIYKNI